MENLVTGEITEKKKSKKISTKPEDNDKITEANQ